MIAPSLLGSDLALLKPTLEMIKENDLSIVHFDVMDNHFVPNLTFGPQFIYHAKTHSSLFFDTHLMIENPSKFIQVYLDIPVHYLTIHYETISSFEEWKKLFSLCQNHLIGLGLALKPSTQIQDIIPFLPYLNGILIMTVEPGFGGQTLIQETIPKIKQLDTIRKDLNLNFIIEADGGIHSSYIDLLYAEGADLLVMGSAYFKNQTQQPQFKQKEKKNNLYSILSFFILSIELSLFIA